MANEIETEVVDTEVEAEQDTPEAELTEATDWEAEAKKARGIAQRLRTKLTKATEKKVAAEQPKEPIRTQASNTGDLDENALDFLDLKGITHDDDIKVIEQIVQRTGMTVRQALKDEYVTSKLDSNKQAREVQQAMPSSTKRGGSGGTSLEAAIAKFEQTNELPTDYDLRSQVVNALEARTSANVPAYKRR